MKRIYVGALLCAILSLGLLTGCDQGVARSLGGSEPITMPSTTASRSWSADMRWRTRMIFGSVPRC